MPRHEEFKIGVFVTNNPHEHLFLSVSKGFEHGPGIQRDGISSPRMTDPHSVAAVVNRLGLAGHPWRDLPTTTNAYVQRAGTWTLYHHLKRFCELHGDKWRIVGVQSNGDLTMNFWHVAFVNQSPNGQKTTLCGLRTQHNSTEPQEPIVQRTYRCLVKWTDRASEVHKMRYEFLNLRFELQTDESWSVKINDPADEEKYHRWLKEIPSYNTTTRDISPHIEFALSGKPIVENGFEVTLANAIDRFVDVRHVFNLQTVSAEGYVGGHKVSSVNFGEYQLFSDVNVRRAALFTPVVIDLQIENTTTTWEEVSAKLKREGYRETQESPMRRGQFRKYSEQAVEIFFPHNVYPFGVLGIRPADDLPERGNEIVGLSSGGRSGQVGNTLEGTARIMFDFFSCTDAIVLDEGFDVFSLINPTQDRNLLYSNEELLERVLSFTKHRVELDEVELAKLVKKGFKYALGENMREWPLNIKLLSELDEDYARNGKRDYADVIVVPPNRSQMRSVLIFAVPQKMPA